MLVASSAASLLLCGPAYSQTSAPVPAAAPAPATTPAPATPAATPAPSDVTPAPQSSQAPASTSDAIALPDVEVTAPKRVQPLRHPPTRVATERRRAPPVAPPPQSAQKRVADTNDRFDEARRALVAPTGAGTYQLSQQALEALPQGTNTPLDKALLQAPGVSQDSASSGELHVRNEHANLQYRINGIMLPDGVGAFGQIIDTGIVGSLALVTGALRQGPPGPYQLQAAIAAIHDEAASAEGTDWPQIVALYELLLQVSDSPVTALNHAVAVAMTRGPRAGLDLLTGLEGDQRIVAGHRFHAVRAHLLELAGDQAAARRSYLEAASRAGSLPHQRYLNAQATRLSELDYWAE